MDRYKSNLFQSDRRREERRYQQVLEEEQRSLARNKKLLEDIDRLEKQMRYFNNECKQDEVRLNQAKDKFRQYVKSVYPKWTEDVKKWQETKKQPCHDVQNGIPPSSDLRRSNRSRHSFTNHEGSPSVPLREDGQQHYHDSSLEYPRKGIRNPKDMMGFPSSRMGHFRDTIGSSRDVMGYPGDMMRHARETMGTSLPRDAMGHSRDEVGYLRDEMGYPKDNMYNGRPWMYPQHSPPSMYPHMVQPYFLPMPGYGVPRWSSTPGYLYDHWSMPNTQDRSFYEDFSEDKCHGFSGKDHPQNVSSKRDENGPRETLLNARNGEHYSGQRNTDHDINSLHRDFTGHPSAENVFGYERYQTKQMASRDATRQNHVPGQGLGRSNQEIDRQRNKGEESHDKDLDSRTLPQRNISDDKQVEESRGKQEVRSRFRAQDDCQVGDRRLFNDRKGSTDSEKIKHLKGEVNDSLASDDGQTGGGYFDEGHIQGRSKLDGPSFNEEQADHMTNSDLDALKQNKPESGDYLGEPQRQTRVMKLRSEGSGFGSRETMNTDSISMPTIHQYEGDIRDLFSDLSSSEPLNQDGSSLTNLQAKKSEPKEAHETDQVGTFGNPKELSTRKISEGKSSIVEDLIGDDASDFEVSETEVSEDDLGAREPEQSGVIDESAAQEKVKHNDFPNAGQDKEERKISLSNESMSQHEDKGDTSPTSKKETKDLSGVLERQENVLKQNDTANVSREHGLTYSSDESISEELPKTNTEGASRKTDSKVNESEVKTDAENKEGMKVDSVKNEMNRNEHSTERKGSTDAERGFSLKEGGRNESREAGMSVGKKKVETEATVEKESEVKQSERDEGTLKLSNSKEDIVDEDKSIEEEIAEDVADDVELVSEDEKSRTGVLEEISFSSAESSSESVPAQEKSKRKESASYTEDFEEEKSIPLTQSAAYRKMLSSVDVSDEGEDIEEEFLQGTMSEANTTAQSTHDMPQTLHDSGTPSQVKLPKAKSKSKPTLSLFSSGDGNDFGNSFNKENDGVLSASWKSSEATLSPPLSPDTGGYVPSVAGEGKVANRLEERKGGKEVSTVDETKAGNMETGKSRSKPQESNTKSRIQAGFWNNSDSESEVDLQISHGGNDDDDDFDFYS